MSDERKNVSERDVRRQERRVKRLEREHAIRFDIQAVAMDDAHRALMRYQLARRKLDIMTAALTNTEGAPDDHGS